MEVQLKMLGGDVEITTYERNAPPKIVNYTFRKRPGGRIQLASGDQTLEVHQTNDDFPYLQGDSVIFDPESVEGEEYPRPEYTISQFVHRLKDGVAKVSRRITKTEYLYFNNERFPVRSYYHHQEISVQDEEKKYVEVPEIGIHIQEDDNIHAMDLYDNEWLEARCGRGNPLITALRR